MMGRTETEDLLWTNLDDLETAYERGHVDSIRVATQCYRECIQEFTDFLSVEEKGRLNARYKAIRGRN